MYIKIGNSLFNAKKVLQISLDGKTIHVRLPTYADHILFFDSTEAEQAYNSAYTQLLEHTK